MDRPPVVAWPPLWPASGAAPPSARRTGGGRRPSRRRRRARWSARWASASQPTWAPSPRESRSERWRVLSAARFLGEAGHRLGLPVTVAQLHGMSQRGGAVQSTVTFGGEQVLAYSRGPVDVLVGLEMLEVLRVVDRVGPGTTVLCNERVSPPPHVAQSGGKVASAGEVAALLRERAGATHILDAGAMARRAGAPTAVNVVMLGALSRLSVCPVPAEALLEAIREGCAPAAWAANREAFALGRAAVG